MSRTVGSEWLEASKAGLERIARRRGLAYVLLELVQNAWDTGAQVVNVALTPVDGRPQVLVTVTDDDPEGFKNIAHAYTLFAESEKKSDPTKRGRFNFGEKLVLAVCTEAEITSTKSRVTFNARGRTVSRSGLRKCGTEFHGTVGMTRDELAEVLAAAKLLIPPSDVTTRINGQAVPARPVLARAETSLKTELADEGGFLREAQRRTAVTVHACLPDQPGRLYEMGIPVCETGDPWDANVHQKVPVNLERNSVSPAYLRSVRVAVVNACPELVTPEVAAYPGVEDAISDPRVEPAALERVLKAQFGEKIAVADPSDREAERRLVAEGYTIIHGRSLAPEVFANIRTHGTVLPAGQISPSPRPYSTDPSAPPRVLIPEAEWTPAMRQPSPPMPRHSESVCSARA